MSRNRRDGNFEDGLLYGISSFLSCWTELASKAQTAAEKSGPKTPLEDYFDENYIDLHGQNIFEEKMRDFDTDLFYTDAEKAKISPRLEMEDDDDGRSPADELLTPDDEAKVSDKDKNNLNRCEQEAAIAFDESNDVKSLATFPITLLDPDFLSSNSGRLLSLNFAEVPDAKESSFERNFVANKKATLKAQRKQEKALELDKEDMDSSECVGSEAGLSWTGSSLSVWLGARKVKGGETMRQFLLRSNLEQLLMSSTSAAGSLRDPSEYETLDYESLMKEHLEKTVTKASAVSSKTFSSNGGPPNSLAAVAECDEMDSPERGQEVVMGSKKEWCQSVGFDSTNVSKEKILLAESVYLEKSGAGSKDTIAGTTEEGGTTSAEECSDRPTNVEVSRVDMIAAKAANLVAAQKSALNVSAEASAAALLGNDRSAFVPLDRVPGFQRRRPSFDAGMGRRRPSFDATSSQQRVTKATEKWSSALKGTVAQLTENLDLIKNASQSLGEKRGPAGVSGKPLEAPKLATPSLMGGKPLPSFSMDVDRLQKNMAAWQERGEALKWEFRKDDVFGLKGAKCDGMKKKTSVAKILTSQLDGSVLHNLIEVLY